MTVPAVVVLVEGHSTGEDRRLRSFCHPVCCVCAVRVDSAIHWNPTATGDPTAGSCHQLGTQGSLQQVTGGRVLRPGTQSVVGLAAWRWSIKNIAQKAWPRTGSGVPPSRRGDPGENVWSKQLKILHFGSF